MLNCVHRSKRPQANQTGFHLSLPALLFRSQNLSQDPHFQSSKRCSHVLCPSEFIWSHHSYLVIVFLNKWIANIWRIPPQDSGKGFVCVFLHRCCLYSSVFHTGKKHICLCLKHGDPYLLNPPRDNVDRTRVAICLVALGNLSSSLQQWDVSTMYLTFQMDCIQNPLVQHRTRKNIITKYKERSAWPLPT